MRIAAIAVLTLLLAVPAGGSTTQGRASLTLNSLTPLVVGGTHFGARELVLVTYLGPNKARRVLGVRAKRNGDFSVSFDVRLDNCSIFTVRAAGLRGSRAVLQVDPGCEQKRKGPPKRAPALPPVPSPG